MYKVVEFAEDTGDGGGAGGGGISVVRVEWLTPQKQHCLWPPHKLMSRFNKCLIEGAIPNDTWEIYSIKRIFYETDNLSKARQKAKKAENDSEVGSDCNQISVRRRKKTRKIYDSDTDGSEDKSDDTAIIYPAPPATPIVSTSTTRQQIEQIRKSTESHTTRSSVDENEESNSKKNKTPVSDVRPAASTHTDHECVPNKDPTIGRPSSVENCDATQSFSSGSLDLTLTPFLKELAPNTDALGTKSPAQLTTENLATDVGTTSLAASNAVIARHLAKLEEGIKDLQLMQREILTRLRPAPTIQAPGAPLPGGVNLPCRESQEIQAIEAWLAADENYMLLVNHLSFVGGNKTATIIRRILEKIFSNKLAECYNWTGKNQKAPLKGLLLMKVVTDAVRRHKEAEKATDAEIVTVISNWFRFTKDRDGGRDRRRIAPTQ